MAGPQKKASSVFEEEEPGAVVSSVFQPTDDELKEELPGFGSASDIGAAPPWWKEQGWNAANYLLGGAKQLGFMGMSPVRGASNLMSAAGVPEHPWMKPIEQALTPKPGVQTWGAKTAEALPYIFLAGPEAAGAKGILGWAVKNLARKLPLLKSGSFGLGALRALLSAGDVATNAVIGGGTAAAIAAANQEDPVAAGKWGAAFPGGGSLGKPILQPAGEIGKDWARNAIARATGVTSQLDRATAKEFTDLMLDEGWMWARKKGMVDLAKRDIQRGLGMRKAAETQMGPDPQMMAEPINQALLEGRDAAWMRGRSGQGIPMTNIKSQDRAVKEFMDIYNEKILPKQVQQPSGEMTYPFKQIDLQKQDSAKFAQQHGHVYTDVGRDMNVSAEADALKVIANVLRKPLEEFAPEDWALANKYLHKAYGLEELASTGEIRSFGKPVQLSERAFGGYGWHMGGAGMTAKNEAPGIATRLYRRLMGGPWWQSSSAQAKDTLANMFLNPTGRSVYRTGNIAADVASQRPGTNKPQQVEQGTTVPINRQLPEKIGLPDTLGVR